jgi:hypothetical protein
MKSSGCGTSRGKPESSARITRAYQKSSQWCGYIFNGAASLLIERNPCHACFCRFPSSFRSSSPKPRRHRLLSGPGMRPQRHGLLSRSAQVGAQSRARTVNLPNLAAALNLIPAAALKPIPKLIPPAALKPIPPSRLNSHPAAVVHPRFLSAECVRPSRMRHVQMNCPCNS